MRWMTIKATEHEIVMATQETATSPCSGLGWRTRTLGDSVTCPTELPVEALFAGVACVGDSRYEAGVAAALFGGCKVAEEPCPSPTPESLLHLL